MSTIKDVAAAAGVSVTTVSYVLNGKKRVSPEVEARVWEAAKKLNYRPNATARNLRKSETRILGFELTAPIKGDISSLMQRFAYGISLEAAQAGYHVITFAAVDPSDAVATYRHMIMTNRVDGFIVADTNWQDKRIEFLLDEDFPFVSFGRTNIDAHYAYVDIDGYNGLQQVIEHLLENGHQKIAFIGWPENSFSGDNRFEGYWETLERSGIVPPARYVRRCDNTIEGGYQSAEKLMSLQEPPTAIACVSDIIAIGAIRYLQQNEYVVGHDVAVTGFDDIPLARFITPPLTTMLQPIEDVEKLLISILLEQFRSDEALEDQILITPELIIRESTDFILTE